MAFQFDSNGPAPIILGDILDDVVFVLASKPYNYGSLNSEGYTYTSYDGNGFALGNFWSDYFGEKVGAVAKGEGLSLQWSGGTAWTVSGTLISLEFVSGEQSYSITDMNFDMSLLVEESGERPARTDLVYPAILKQQNWVFNLSDAADEAERTNAPVNFDGNDTFNLNGGNDTLHAGDGNDIIMGGAGDDVLNGEEGADTLYGGAGNDHLKDYAGGNSTFSNYLDGGDGNDTISVSNSFGANTLHGGAGDDAIFAGHGADSVSGGIGDDRIFGDTGYDQSLGSNDTLAGGGGNDSIFGREGNDFITGGDGDDSIEGEEGDDVIYAGQGDTGSDLILGGSGNDTIGGGGGDDTLYGGSTDSSYGSHTDLLFGGAGNDYVLVKNDDTAWAGSGNDTVEGNSGFGFGRIVGGGSGADTIKIGLGNDTVYGGAGADRIEGDRYNDYNSNNFTDLLFGGSGNDTLYGGVGTDTLFGGDGDDVYLFALGDHSSGEGDYIGGFTTKGSDTINLSALNLPGFDALTISQSGVDTVIDTGAGTITLWNTNALDISKDDFVF